MQSQKSHAERAKDSKQAEMEKIGFGRFCLGSFNQTQKALLNCRNVKACDVFALMEKQLEDQWLKALKIKPGLPTIC